MPHHHSLPRLGHIAVLNTIRIPSSGVKAGIDIGEVGDQPRDCNGCHLYPQPLLTCSHPLNSSSLSFNPYVWNISLESLDGGDTGGETGEEEKERRGGRDGDKRWGVK